MGLTQGFETQPSASVRPVGGVGLLKRLGPHDADFEARMCEALVATEKWLQDATGSAPDPRVAELTGHIGAAGGKRLRPLLVLLGAEFGDPWRDGVIQAGAVAELVHLASLYHDDVMDAAATRHGVPSAHARWGERAAVFGGDWLLARAAQFAADLGPGIVRLNAETAGRLVSGQLRELTGPAPGEDPVDHYFQVVAGKTAALLAMALAVGGVQSGAPAEHVAALTEYGEHLGAAFQVADDLLDLRSPAELTGKELGKDLLAGVPSLPVLLAEAGDHPRDAALRARLTAGPSTDVEWHLGTVRLLAASRAAEETEALMHARLDLARLALARLPRRPARDALDALCDYVAVRTA